MKKFTSYSFLILMFVLAANLSHAGNGPGKNVVTTVPFYLEDFSSGLSTEWQSNDSTPATTGLIWKYTTTGASNGFDDLNPTGTTAANGYMIFDSDSLFGTDGDGWLITDTIDCSSRSNIHLTFNEFYIQGSGSIGKVYVSTDGTTWSAAVYDVSNGLAEGDPTTNPHAVDISIPAADGQATVFIAFQYKGTGGYYWMLDDVGLYENPVTDAGVIAILAPVTTCDSLTAAETVTVSIKNFGASPIVNPDVAFFVGANIPDTETVIGTINPGDTLDYTFTAKADLSILGAHKITAFTSVAGDIDLTNDDDSTYIYVGSHTIAYVMDFDLPIEYIGWAFVDGGTIGTTWIPSPASPHSGGYSADYTQTVPGTADDWMISPCLDFRDISTSYMLSFQTHTFSPLTDATLEVVLMDSQDPTTATKAPIISNMLITNTTYLQVDSAFSITTAGTYYLGFHITNTANPTNLYIDDINVQFGVKTPSISNNTSNVIVYPNPNNGTFSIANLNSFSGNVQVSVIDMMGRTVSEQMVNGVDKLTLNLDNQSAGIYTVRISNDAQVLNKLITITK